jgi:ATP-dependent Lon protease
VRDLERELSSLIRKAVKEPTLRNEQSITVKANAVADYLARLRLRPTRRVDRLAHSREFL